MSGLASPWRLPALHSLFGGEEKGDRPTRGRANNTGGEACLAPCDAALFDNRIRKTDRGRVNSKTLIIGFAVAVALVAALSIYVSKTIDPVEKTVTAVVAPDGRYKAVVVSLAQGGDAPFCYESVSIYFAIYPNDFAESEKSYQVYWSPCATPAKPADKPKAEWLASDEVRITYTQGPPAADAAKLRKRAVDASRSVKVSYVERK